MKELQGQRVLLRGIRESDIDDRWRLGRSDEFSYMCGGDRTGENLFPDREHWVRWYESQLKLDCAWIIDLDGRCIGGARLTISQGDRSARYAIGIYDTQLLSKGIGSEVTQLVLGYAFDKLKLHRVDLKVLEYNTRGIRCYEKCGFKREAVLRDSAYVEGAFHSDWIMSILEDEWRNRT